MFSNDNMQMPDKVLEHRPREIVGDGKLSSPQSRLSDEESENNFIIIPDASHSIGHWQNGSLGHDDFLRTKMAMICQWWVQKMAKNYSNGSQPWIQILVLLGLIFSKLICVENDKHHHSNSSFRPHGRQGWFFGPGRTPLLGGYHLSSISFPGIFPCSDLDAHAVVLKNIYLILSAPNRHSVPIS
jgi:hypothetical protein